MTNDIVRRLRRWVHSVDAVSASDIMDEAADEIERLREASSRLSDEERKAIESVVAAYELDDDDEECSRIASALRTLLERLK